MSDDDNDPPGGEKKAKELADRLSKFFKDEDHDPEQLRSLLRGAEAADIATIIDTLDLNPDQYQRILASVEEACAAEILTELAPERLNEIVAHLDKQKFGHLIEILPHREAARVAADAPDDFMATAKKSDPAAAEDAAKRAAYPPGSAGRLMTGAFVRLHPEMTAQDALDALRRTDPDADTPENLYVIEAGDSGGHGREKLQGVISIRAIVMADPARGVGELMARDIVTTKAGDADGVAARLFSKHQFSTLPVIDDDGFLVGVIPAEDLMKIVVARLHRRYARAVGTDAQAMEDATPFQEAKMRVPWLLGTMLLEMGAGVVIAHFSHVLEKIILLASFMPVISAVAGNVGLQAAAITVRGLDTGQMSLRKSGSALLKEGTVTLFMGAVCAFVLGTIGVIWSRHLMFGVVIAIALGCSMFTACVMGTVIPMVSKKLGFDPATTAGPFETAFQDIIGFGVFLGLATLMLR